MSCLDNFLDWSYSGILSFYCIYNLDTNCIWEFFSNYIFILLIQIKIVANLVLNLSEIMFSSLVSPIFDIIIPVRFYPFVFWGGP